MADNLKQEAALTIFDLINRDNPGLALNKDVVTLGIPTAATVGTRNTDLPITAIKGSGYKGSVIVNYNRLHLQNNVAVPALSAGANLTFGLGDAKTIKDFIPEINTALGIQLLVGLDLADGPLPTFQGTANETHDVTFPALEDSLCFIGSLTFTIKSEDIDLAAAVTNRELNGLTYQPPASTK